jgi:hypothetical protein
MTKTETAALLTLVAAFDRRTIGEADVEAWHLIVADLEPNDCMEAVRSHYMTETRWLMPADVRTFAKNAERRREGQRRIAEREAEIAAENPGELHAKDVKAITAGRFGVVPFDAPVRAERRAELRKAAHARRESVAAEAESRRLHRERVEAARAELHPESAS